MTSFQVQYPAAPARLGKHFQVKPSATCRYDDGRDARWAITGARVDAGELPPGLVIEDGAIGGVPTKPGTYSAKIALTGVSCAGKALPDQVVDVTISAR